MNKQTTNQRKTKKYIINLAVMLLFFPIALFYMELVVRIFTIGVPSLSNLLNMFLFSFSAGAFISVIVTLIKNRTALRIVIIALTAIMVLLLGSQLVYFKIFSTYYSLDSVGMAGEAMTDFKMVMFDTIFKNLFVILLLALPLILISVFNGRITNYPARKMPPILTYFCVSVMALSFILGSFSVCADKDELGALYYYRYPDIAETTKNVGLFTSTRLSLQKMIFGGLSEDIVVQEGMNDVTPGFDTVPGTDNPPSPPPSSSEEELPPIVYGDNVIEGLDFSKTGGDIGKLNTYFSSLTPSKKNQYTGMFEGYNLIFLTLEGFSGKVINPNLTPTLYKMSTEGFVFNNFYNGTWGGSTATGEYANLTGNFYNSTKCMTDYIANTYQPFVLGNQFKSLGYTTMAFHAGTRTYYNRYKSFPTLGYNKFYAEGSGLENLTDRDGNKIKFQWPESDHQLAKVSVEQYLDKEPFHIYYMTISGHTNYSWVGNNMCKKHKAEINAYCQQYGLSYSDQVKAYLACQLEVELMLTELIERLDEVGKLDNTVFVMGADHYPYGLSDASLAELYGIPQSGIHGNFELFRNSLIIWNSAMEEPVIVDTPCSAIDILPTVSNLFGLKYDSRLMAGTDVLSDQDPIVIINFDGSQGSWNWITRYGSYKTATKKFTVAEGFNATQAEIDAYVKKINNLVSAKKTYTMKVLTTDYYSYVFGKK